MTSDDAEPLKELLEAAETSRQVRAVSQDVDEFQIIRFRCGEREFAVTIDVVERTERVPMVTPVPRSPTFIRGVANLRGGVVAVIDLRGFLSGEIRPEAPSEAKSLLVLGDGARRVGVLSDSLPDFQRVTQAETMSIPPTELEIYSCAVERDGQLVGIIDPSKLFDWIERRLSAV